MTSEQLQQKTLELLQKASGNKPIPKEFLALAQAQGILSIHATAQTPKDDTLNKFITTDKEMIEVKGKIRKLMDKSIPVLIVGETGTGKEILAQSLHAARKGLFLGVNCAGVVYDLLESEFFGAMKGAYTGCVSNRVGYFEQAKDGTLFLDEISELPYQLQSKLLRVLEEKEIHRVGDSTPTKINCRIVSASNRLEMLSASGRKVLGFREDLYHRLAGTKILTKPLRERREDIPHLVKCFDSEGKIPFEQVRVWIEKEALEGNVRELRNLVEEWLQLN